MGAPDVSRTWTDQEVSGASYATRASIEGNSQIRDTEDSTAFVTHALLNYLIRSRQ